MDSYHDRLVREINEQLDHLAEAGDRWIAGWIANTICDEHRAALPDKDGSEFWRWNTYQHVRKMVGQQINKRAGGQAHGQQKHQLALPGFERRHLQDYYVVERGGGEEGVPVTKLTDVEIRQKVGYYRAMGTACSEHADELLRYMEWRIGSVPAQAVS